MTKTLTKADLIQEVEEQHIALTKLRVGVVTVDQLCTILGVAEGELRAWKAKGLPTNSQGIFGLTYDFKLSDVFEWVRKHEREQGRLTVTLTGNEIWLIRTALGLHRRQHSYRNRHVTTGGKLPVWEDLVMRGLANREVTVSTITYSATRRAAEAVLLPGESLSDDDFAWESQK